MQKIINVLKTDTAKNTALIFLLTFTSYVVFISNNAKLFYMDQIWIGFMLFIALPVTLSVITMLFIKNKKIMIYIIFNIFILLLFRGFWGASYDFLYNWSIGWAEMPLRIILFCAVHYIATRVVLRFYKKVIPFVLIFTLPFLIISGQKAYEKISSRIALENSKEKTQKYYAQFEKDANFTTKPNIYHLMIDSYPHNDVLKRIYNFDNSYFYKQLKKRGLSVHDKVYAPNASTKTTMRSIFSMTPSEHKIQPYTFIGQNKAWGTLFMGGYKAFCEYPCSTHPSKIDNMTDFIKYVDYQNYSSIVSFYLEHQFGRFYSVINTADIATNFNSLSAYYRGKTALKNTAPFVSYVHHVPSPVPTQKRADILNESVLEILQDIEANDPDSIIILHSDHGSREKWMTKRPTETDSADEIFGILSAVKFPRQCNRFNTLKNIAPVNYYAYIHACLRGEDTPKILYPADSTMVGKTMKGYWSSRGGRKTYTHIKDGVILEKPVEFVAEPLKTTQKRIGLLTPE